MKIVVIGGTGLIGSKLVAKLTEQGHETVPASPRLGIDTITGEGLAAALDSASVVVDVSNSPSFDFAPAIEFFGKSTTNLRNAEENAGVGHHVALSVVGTKELAQSADLTTTIAGYFWAKLTQEALIKASPIPHTIVHATQFFEFVEKIADGSTDGDTVRLPPALFQPMAAEDVATALCRAAVETPVNGTVEVGGPEQFRLDMLIRRALDAKGDPREVLTDPHARYFGAPVAELTLVPGPDATLGEIRFDDWLRQSAGVETAAAVGRPLTPGKSERHHSKGVSTMTTSGSSTTVAPTTISEREQAQVERANATTATPVIFIHGLWLLPSSWDPGPRCSRRPGTSP